MTKTELKQAVGIYRDQIKEALQITYDSLNQGQKKQLLKNEKVKELFDLYGVKQ